MTAGAVLAAPAEPPRHLAPDFFAPLAERAAASCGMTRLARITGLDRIGLPVWQAVRPLGRALSVHQGKGASDLAARISACCEAVESDCAERVAADGPVCRWEDLPTAARAPDPSDHLRRRDDARPGTAIPWCQAEDLVSGAEHFLPFALVSLDFTRDLPSPYDRTSSGLAVGTSLAEARFTALCELVERDAVGHWARGSAIDRLDCEIEPSTLPFDWFAAWRDSLAAIGARLRLFAPPGVGGLPVLICWLVGPGEYGALRSFVGSAASHCPERALFDALAEACQSRLTFISGARDDIMPEEYEAQPPASLWPAPPLPTRWKCAPWPEPGPAGDALVEAIAEAGYPQLVVKRLDSPLPELSVLRAFVPGLGTRLRTRRAAS